MNIEKNLYQAAVQQAQNRYPEGWSGAAAIRTESGKILTSVAPDVINDALSLCMEVGALLEAFRLNETVTHSICVCRDEGQLNFRILSPCGICQERLLFWGKAVNVAVSNPDNKLLFKPLGDLQPYHWQ